MANVTLDQVIEEVKELTPKEQLELYRLLEQIIEEEEDRLDVEDAERRLADPNEVPIPWEQVKKNLGLE